MYKSLLKKNGIDVVSVSEPLIDGPFGSLIERIIEWMDEYYSIRLAGEVTRGMTEKALRGGYQSSPGLGYRIEHKGELPVIVPEEAEIIKTIFDKYINENLSAFQITRYLNALGLKTKDKNDFERRSIEYILQNPLYKGYIRWNRSENATNIIKDETEWIVVIYHIRELYPIVTFLLPTSIQPVKQAFHNVVSESTYPVRVVSDSIIKES